MNDNKKKKSSWFKWLCLIAYIGCATTIIVESCIPGASSAQQSNAVGGSLGNIINDISKDQTKFVELKKVEITNKITQASIGDTHQILTTVSPDNATNKSITFESSDLSIATINENGLISFVGAGNVTIKAFGTFHPNVVDTFDVEVKEVFPSSISVNLPQADFDTQLNAYKLFIGNYYQIETSILPINTTNKSYSYNITNNSSNAIKIENDTIKAQYYNQREKIDIEVCTNVDNTIKTTFSVIVDFDHITEIESLSFSQGTSSEIFINESKKLTVIYTPANVSFKDVVYESDDTQIATFTNGTIKGKKVGTTTVRVKSTRDSSKFAEHTVTVKALPNLEDFKINGTIVDITVGSSKKISITKIPTNASVKNSLFTYKSDNDSIASVDQNGKISALTPGNATITVTYNNSISHTMTVTVKEKVETSVSSIILKTKDNITSLNVNETITDIFSLSFLPANATVNDKTFEIIPLNSDDINDTSLFNPEDYETSFINSELATYDLTTNTLTANDKEGFVFFMAYHVASGFQSNIIKLQINEILPTDLNLIVNDKVQTGPLQVHLDSLNNLAKQEVKIGLSCDTTNATYTDFDWSLKTLIGTDVARLEHLETDDEYNIHLIPTNEGIVQINATISTPILKHSTSVSFVVEIIHWELTHFFITDKDNQIIPENSVHYIFRNQQEQLGFTTNDPYSRYLFSWTSEDTNIATVDSHGLISGINCGQTTITATNTYNNESHSIIVKVINKLALDEENSYTITGPTLKKISDNKFKFKNGNTISIKMNFAEDATYTKVTYKSSNENVITIGPDGVMSALKVGKATISVIYTDKYSVSEPFVIELQFVVEKQPLINDIQEFSNYIRKALGHFGVFFVLAIASFLTYILFFKEKQWIYSIPLHFFSGYMIALISEFIQLYVPGRGGCYRDVRIDYSGFILASIIAFSILALIYGIKLLVWFIKKQTKKNKENSIVEVKNKKDKKKEKTPRKKPWKKKTKNKKK